MPDVGDLSSTRKRALRALGTTGAVREANVSRATGDICRGRHVPSKPGAISLPIKKRAKRALGTGDTCRRRHILSKPGAISLPIKKSCR